MQYQSHRSSEKYIERKWRYHEASSAKNYYRVPQQRSYYQPAPYNECQYYLHDRTTQKVPSINLHDKEIVNTQSSMHCVIPPP